MTPDVISLGGAPALSVGTPDAKCAVVLLHGFQMTPADLAPFASSLNLPAWFVFPEGPLAAEVGRSWWHIDTEARARAMAEGPRDFFEVHPAELDAARNHLVAVLADVKKQLGDRPLILGGFSQGGMVSSDAVIRGAVKVDALALLSSSRVAFSEWRPHIRPGAFQGLPVFISHGEADDDLAYSAGEALRDAWKETGADVRWLSFQQGHLIPLVVWRHLRKFILERLAGA